MLSLDHLDIDVGVGNEPAEHGFEEDWCALDLKIESDDLAAGLVEDDDVGLADRDAGQVDARATCG